MTRQFAPQTPALALLIQDSWRGDFTREGRAWKAVGQTYRDSLKADVERATTSQGKVQSNGR